MTRRSARNWRWAEQQEPGGRRGCAGGNGGFDDGGFQV